MSPITPFWSQPSHPEIQEVICGEDENGYTTKSISRVTLPPFAIYAEMDFPPCTLAREATYATVQIDTNKHLNLNSDLLYINHSCEPSLIFDPQNQHILAGPQGLRTGQELTFFYPSTEWSMSQAFLCHCGADSCVGWIKGAGQMDPRDLEGKWLSGHVRRGLEEERNGNGNRNGNGASKNSDNDKRAVENGYEGKVNGEVQKEMEEKGHISKMDGNGNADGEINGRRGVTSREMSGEMGGDTL